MSDGRNDDCIVHSNLDVFCVFISGIGIGALLTMMIGGCLQ